MRIRPIRLFIKSLVASWIKTRTISWFTKTTVYSISELVVCQRRISTLPSPTRRWVGPKTLVNAITRTSLSIKILTASSTLERKGKSLSLKPQFTNRALKNVSMFTCRNLKWMKKIEEALISLPIWLKPGRQSIKPPTTHWSWFIRKTKRCTSISQL